MKASLRIRLAALATAALSATSTFTPLSAVAGTFGQTEVNQDKVIAIAAPVGETSRHQLLVLEQISSTRPCWKETGANPVEIDPLLLDFNFSGICGRATDSNGYSIRVAGEDMGMRYSLRVEEQGDDLVLMGVPFGRRNNPPLEIARANGVSSGFAKLELNPGWRFSKRNYQGRTLGHHYLTSDLTLSELAETSPVASRPTPRPTPRPVVRPEIPAKPSEPTISERFELTIQQAREIAAIRQTYTARMATGRSELEQAQARLNEMLAEDTSTRSLRRQQKVVRELQADLSDLYFDGMMEVRGVLTSEQRGEFAQLVAQLGNFENLSGRLVGSAR